MARLLEYLLLRVLLVSLFSLPVFLLGLGVVALAPGWGFDHVFLGCSPLFALAYWFAQGVAAKMVTGPMPAGPAVRLRFAELRVFLSFVPGFGVRPAAEDDGWTEAARDPSPDRPASKTKPAP